VIYGCPRSMAPAAAESRDRAIHAHDDTRVGRSRSGRRGEARHAIASWWRHTYRAFPPMREGAPPACNRPLPIQFWIDRIRACRAS